MVNEEVVYRNKKIKYNISLIGIYQKCSKHKGGGCF